MCSIVSRMAVSMFAALVFGLGLHGYANAVEPSDNDAWSAVRDATFGTRDILDGAGKIELQAPYRAEDASTVPISVRMPAEFAKNVKAMTLIIDQNPMPIVATFTFGEAAGAKERVLATRVRINQYSNVRAIAEMADGKLYMAARFVKASGGCSAPASKDPAEAAKSMGRMKIKTAFKDPKDASLQEAAVMIKHPNNSGMQMNQLTGLYIPPHYINKLEVRTDGQLVFSMAGGISISENPHFRFTYSGNSSDPMTVHVEDSEGMVFDGRSTPGQS